VCSDARSALRLRRPCPAIERCALAGRRKSGYESDFGHPSFQKWHHLKTCSICNIMRSGRRQ
jgi:hypothetical protein